MEEREEQTNQINGSRKVGAKYHHNKQAQQVTTIDRGFVNRALDDHSHPP